MNEIFERQFTTHPSNPVFMFFEKPSCFFTLTILFISVHLQWLVVAR